MAKNLRLKRLERYNGPLTRSTPITKGEIIRVSDESAKHMMAQTQRDAAGSDNSHWEVTEDAPDYDFSDVTPAGARKPDYRVRPEEDGKVAIKTDDSTKEMNVAQTAARTATKAVQRKAR